MRAADALAGPSLPIHLMWGRDDPYFTLDLAERSGRRVEASLDVVDNARTYVMRDQPSTLAAVMRRRLSRSVRAAA